MKVLTHHIGYGSNGYKKAILQGEASLEPGVFRVVASATGKVVHYGTAVSCGEVASWGLGGFWTLGFSAVQEEGSFRIEVDTNKGMVSSEPFSISDSLIPMRLLSASLAWFKGQRSSGEWLSRDRHLPFSGPREGCVDVHGGWFDATGDTGIHLSHLSHSTWHNPQQAAFSAFSFFRMMEWLESSGQEQYYVVKRRLLDEAFWGADFLMRMRAPSGSFFRSISRGDAFGRVEEQRKMGFEYHESSTQFGEAATAGKETITDDHYETSFRSGGGYAIATLAMASRFSYPGTDFTAREYLEAAQKAYTWLEKNNERYTNNGKWNLVDEYCALDALTAIYRASLEYDVLRKARLMADRILDRMVLEAEGTARFEVEPGVPFHHASDAGLPVVSLMQYREVELDADRRASVLTACEQAMAFEMGVTEEVANPFGYARFLYRDQADGQMKKRFFFPHNSTAAPWWQGENARIASLATAASMVAGSTTSELVRENLRRYATDQLNWIMGLNPFDSCMMEGYGRNHIQYFFNGRYDFLNTPGGICNGITSGLDDEEGIAFVQEPTVTVSDNWRWAEQWIPHATWFMNALAVEVGTGLR